MAPANVGVWNGIKRSRNGGKIAIFFGGNAYSVRSRGIFFVPSEAGGVTQGFTDCRLGTGRPFRGRPNAARRVDDVHRLLWRKTRVGSSFVKRVGGMRRFANRYCGHQGQLSEKWLVWRGAARPNCIFTLSGAPSGAPVRWRLSGAPSDAWGGVGWGGACLAWGGACPAHLLSAWLWLTKWLAAYRDHARRLSGEDASAPPSVGLARARFGLSMAASGTSASRKNVLGGRNLPPRKGGTRLHLMNGVGKLRQYWKFCTTRREQKKSFQGRAPPARRHAPCWAFRRQ